MLRNPNGLHLKNGSYYMLKSSEEDNRLAPNKVKQYTSDSEDAYFASGLFGPKCNETVLCEMKEVAL